MNDEIRMMNDERAYQRPISTHNETSVSSPNGATHDSSLDAKSGKPVWDEKLPGNFSASPILAGKTLDAVTEDGVCYVVEILPAVARIGFETDMAERTLASPVLLAGALYLRTEKHLWKITGE